VYSISALTCCSHPFSRRFRIHLCPTSVFRCSWTNPSPRRLAKPLMQNMLSWICFSAPSLVPNVFGCCSVYRTKEYYREVLKCERSIAGYRSTSLFIDPSRAWTGENLHRSSLQYLRKFQEEPSPLLSNGFIETREWGNRFVGVDWILQGCFTYLSTGKWLIVNSNENPATYLSLFGL